MASPNSGNDCSTPVPQWKRDLIQRRRQQNKVLTSNGANAKLCSAVSGQLSTAGSANDSLITTSGGEPVGERLTCSNIDEQHGVVGGAPCILTSKTPARVADNIASYTEQYSTPSNRAQHQLGGSTTKLSCQASCGATCTPETAIPCLNAGTLTGGERPNQSASGGASHEDSSVSLSSSMPVVCNMRLDTDASSFCPSSEDATSFNNNSSPRNNHAILISSVIERVEFDNNYDNGDENNMRNYSNNGGLKRSVNNREQECDNGGGIATRIIRKMDGSVCLYPTEGRKNRKESNLQSNSNGKIVGDECESDSSEELQYGPGIVNRLKSKYLNLTLREMNQSRVTVQRFRRAASLEDLLDCDDCDQSEKTNRKYAKRSTPVGAAVKTDRYRNATRGNESMKRARSVETLMRYNAPLINEDCNRLNALRQETANDHIVLIDRTSVKIESRLADPDRPKAVNKPKRIKPLLAETERPPPDLVKTTMRLFEGSVKKFKPKGEVAVKVATFKTINDTYKAQTMKKVVPKPPIQPKPFVNGNNKISTSPKKVLLTSKPTAEIIEQTDNEEYKREGVVTETIVQSVSSVVSKFQQIEKSYSPSASPEPNYKLKFSPSPSPEPLLTSKLNRSNENLVKSPPVTPVSSPRISSPASPKRESLTRQQSSPTNPPSATSPNRELSRQISVPEVSKLTPPPSEDNSRDKNPIEELGNLENIEDHLHDDQSKLSDLPDQSLPSISFDNPIETVDGSRTISKLALDNISKAGITMQYNFGDKPSIGKSYLPGANVTSTLATAHNGQKSETSLTPSSTNGETSTISQVVKMASPTPPLDAISSCSSPISIDSINEDIPERLGELSGPETSPEPKSNDKTSSTSGSIAPAPATTTQSEYTTKPIGAISSLGLIKSSPISSHSPANEISGKIIKHHKSEASPPQKQIGIIRPLVSTKTQQSQQNLSNRELEKNLINRVKSIEQPTKVVVSLKTADEITPPKKNTTSSAGTGNATAGTGGGGGLWDSKHWNTPNNTMVFNFSNRKDVPDYIENDGLIIRRKREKPKVKCHFFLRPFYIFIGQTNILFSNSKHVGEILKIFEKLTLRSTFEMIFPAFDNWKEKFNHWTH